METPINNSRCRSVSSVTNYCRCCLSEGCYKDIKNEYYFGGQKEIYETMLMETFNIQIPNKSGPSHSQLICEGCITRLRDANDFKRMVALSEDTLRMHEAEMQLDNEFKDLPSDKNLTISEIKTESDKATLNECCQENDNHFDDADDEILANIKLEITKSVEVQKQSNRKKMKIDKSKKRGRIKENIIEKQSYESETAKEVKVSERRGNGPILRDNSLKLIKNSTICIFQWNKSRYRCFCCKEPFSDFDLLREHTDKEHTLQNIEKRIILQQNRLVKCEISTLTCKLCKIDIENLSQLKHHLTKQHQVEFLLNEDLLVPFKIQYGGLTCQICRENFTVFRLLNIHMNKHYQKQVCHVCGAVFSNLVFLNLHKTRSHRVLSCNLCDLTFSNRIDKKYHDVKVHNVVIERKLRFPCPYCNERFYQENLRVLHLVEKHDMPKPEHKCQNCAKVFVTRSLLNNHIKYVHLKEKSHECKICHKYFYTKSDVIRHHVTHTGAKNFSCSVCSTCFATKDSLRRHMKRTHDAC